MQIHAITPPQAGPRGRAETEPEPRRTPHEHPGERTRTHPR